MTIIDFVNGRLAEEWEDVQPPENEYTETEYTETESVDTVEIVAAYITARMPRESWPFWFDGWPGEIEAAVLDAVFSARAT